MTQPGTIRIGTSNLTLPGPKTTFPSEFQQKSRLHYYSSIFPTIEINGSFYKIPKPATLKKWTLDTSANFLFTLKLYKEVTHAKELHSDMDSLIKFLHSADAIGSNKGCLLIQFPGKISLDYYNQVENILTRIRKEESFPKWKLALEFRDPVWYTGETYELADEFGATLVLHDFKKAKLWQPHGQIDFLYQRFHGPAGDYRGSYDDHQLLIKANELKKWASQGKDVFVYFNNTIGNAFENALTLQEMIHNPS